MFKFVHFMLKVEIKDDCLQLIKGDYVNWCFYMSELIQLCFLSILKQ